MNRIDIKFNELKKKNKKALIPFVTAGDPNIATTEKIVLNICNKGADIVEIGLPYSDPLADGPIIQNSSQNALKNGVKTKDIMNCVKNIREHTDTPIVYLVYYNSIFRYGVDKFISDSGKCGVDGIIIPDLPIEERESIIDIAKKYEVYLIPLVAPTSKDRIKQIVNSGGGFVYCVSKNGVTGITGNINTNMKEYIDIVATYTDLPKAIGFGIKGPKMVAKFKEYCNGIIVGSALVDIIDKSSNEETVIKNAGSFVEELREALDS
ncbi:tryptophan synthase subunit alpha [Clostridium sp. cel8]|jgi:tryptophan synthase alpha chain|uniref:tryptophan synthase subunit alpha n=1 Tax=unclassified Clostridium TaxID=2614128 RepID=UPI0015F64F3E|nr:tryptophan synthase subunit alpha [Clostridium sp. cel8]MBA5851915.1 tryptophan synthase subunit alpha [Clostridium sp. cel8]